MIGMQQIDVNVEDLLLDPNNYRFYDMSDYQEVSREQYRLESVQAKAEQLLRRREEDLDALKASILQNGYVRFESIVLERYGDDGACYLVVEGNRRVAAARWILSDHQSGVAVPDTVLQSLKTLPALLAPDDQVERDRFVAALMGVRHVSGVKEWGAYQQALLLAQLRDKQGYSASQAADTVGLSIREANRRYRALRALEQMQRHDEYSRLAKPQLYAMFHEAVAIPIVREQWLEWDDDAFEAKDTGNARLFYEWLVGAEPEEDGDGEPKLRTSRDVRELKKIIPSSDALAVLMDPEKTLSDALAEVADHEGGWIPKARAALRAIQRIAAEELENLDDAPLELLTELGGAVTRQLDRHTKLTGTDRA